MSDDDAVVNQGLVDGKFGMEFMADFNYDAIAQLSPEKVKNLSLMPVTLGDDYLSATVSLAGRALGVPKNSKHKAKAKEFINFMMQPDIFKVITKPFKGPSPYKGFESEMNSWQQEMSEMIEANNIPVTMDTTREALGTFQIGDGLMKAFQDIYAGKAIDKALDDWYKDYAQLNRAKKTPGF